MVLGQSQISGIGISTYWSQIFSLHSTWYENIFLKNKVLMLGYTNIFTDVQHEYENIFKKILMLGYILWAWSRPNMRWEYRFDGWTDPESFDTLRQLVRKLHRRRMLVSAPHLSYNLFFVIESFLLLSESKFVAFMLHTLPKTRAQTRSHHTFFDE